MILTTIPLWYIAETAIPSLLCITRLFACPQIKWPSHDEIIWKTVHEYAQVIIWSHLLQEGPWTISSTGAKELLPGTLADKMHLCDSMCLVHRSALGVTLNLSWPSGSHPFSLFIGCMSHPKGWSLPPLFSQELQSGDLLCSSRLDESPGNGTSTTKIMSRQRCSCVFHAFFWPSSWYILVTLLTRTMHYTATNKATDIGKTCILRVAGYKRRPSTLHLVLIGLDILDSMWEKASEFGGI